LKFDFNGEGHRRSEASAVPGRGGKNSRSNLENSRFDLEFLRQIAVIVDNVLGDFSANCGIMRAQYT